MKRRTKLGSAEKAGHQTLAFAKCGQSDAIVLRMV
jgi:hypothetical protein